jgi:two-component system, chemotaxis family, protein-glutamate methylesterase/glutaminase
VPPPSLVVIGASAGGLEALISIVKQLSPDFPATVLIVLHTPANGNTVLPRILERHAELPVSFAKDGERIIPGRIHVAPPDHHLIVSTHGVRVLHGPRENGFRPAVDPLFRTAARAFGPQVVGVILSGALDDGTFGLNVIKQAGGLAIVQDPRDAIVPSMPQSALKHVDVDFVAAAAEIPAILSRLVAGNRKVSDIMARKKEPEPQLPESPTEVATMQQMYGGASGLTCPECGGALWEIKDDRVTRYQCHTGHQFAPDSLQAEQRDAIDAALWTAVRVLEEHSDLKARMAHKAAAQGLGSVAEGFEHGARDAHAHAQQIRAVLFAADNDGPMAEAAEVARLPVDLARRNGSSKRAKPKSAAKRRANGGAGKRRGSIRR